MKQVEAKSKKSSHNQDRTVWIALTIFIGLILIMLIGYGIRVYLNQSYYNYKNVNGDEYKIVKVKEAGLIYYYMTVFDANNQGFIYNFRNHPKDLEDINLEPNLIEKLNRPGGIRKLYVTQDPELGNMTNSDSVQAIYSFEQILTGNAGMFHLDISNTYTTKFLNYNNPITCNNVNDTTAVIYVKVGDESKIYSENGCIIIQGRGANGVVRAGEKFAYSLLGVF